MKKKRAMRIVNKWRDSNDPHLVEKNLRFAARKASQLGTDKALAAFEAAAAASGRPNPPPLVACNIFERLPVIVPDYEPWEEEFLAFSEARAEQYAREYPSEFWDRHIGGQVVAAAPEGDAGAGGAGGGAGAGGSGGSGGGGDGGGEGGGAMDAEEAELARAAEAKKQAAAAAASATSGGAGGSPALGAFYDGGGGDEDDEDDEEEGAADWVPAPRVTAADAINNQRSLDRRLAERLVFVVKSKATGRWELPGLAWPGDADTPVRDTARAAISASFGNKVDVWYPGNAPVGHYLQVYDEATAEATGCYGAKLFLYRAQLLGGFISLGEAYSDYRWLTHEETAEVFEPEFYEYVRQVL